MPGDTRGAVTVALYAGLRAYVVRLGSSAWRNGRLVWPLPAEPVTVADLLCALGVPTAEAKLIFVNGRARGLCHPLSAGDEVGVFPPVGGG